MPYPVSPQYREALASNQVRYTVTATVTSGGQPVPGYTDLLVESATLTCSRTQAQRTTLALTLDPLVAGCGYIVPTGLSSPLAPNGNEIVLAASLEYPTGGTETVPCGVYPIQSVVVTDTGTDMTVQVACADRSWSISRRVLLAPYTIPAGVTLDQALYQLLTANTSGMPPFTYSISTSSAAAPVNTYNEGQDPWQAALDLASGAGYECYFDRHGNLAARPIPTPGTTASTWDAAETLQNGPLGVTRTLTANQVSNDFIVFSSSSQVSPPIRAEASDQNPASGTYVEGNFGDIATFLSSSTIADSTGAEAAAVAQLNASLGQIDTLQLVTIPNPAVDIDDVYTVTRNRAGLNGEAWVVDGYTLPFQVGSTMTVALRRVTM